MENGVCIMSDPTPLVCNAETSRQLLAKRKHPFGDLGKPTLRGVRKCPKCGTFNGTRGLICKNKDCDVVFKERERKKGHSAESVKIITGSTSQLFSVRLRDRGPDYRGFVQLPYIQDADGNPATVLDQSVLIAASVCFVESCNRGGTQDPNMIFKQNGEDHCVHIRAALSCNVQAQPIGLKNTVLENLRATNEMRRAIWLLATETSGPVVQRVTKNIMSVKCKVTAKQPLGFLHCAFFETTRNRQQPDYKFHCTCRAFKVRNYHPVRDEASKRCLHYYACICAFASDEKLSEEFSYFINLDPGVLTISPERQVMAMYQQVEETLAVATDTDTLEVIISQDDLLVPTADKKMKKDDPLAQASSALLTLQEQKQPASSVLYGNQVKQEQQTIQYHFQQQQQQQQPPTQQQPQTQQIQHAVQSQPAKLQAAKKTGTQNTVDEYLASISFHQWLASVTERINQTMHYGFPGTPDPLVFHVPQIFFDCLQQRISAGTRKKRLPNFTTAFVRKEALPLGTFTKFTWHITNLGQVKHIFDTQETSLDLTRSFVENRDGTFDPYEAPRNDALDSVKNKNHTPIRPFELKTFLKAGVSSDHKEVTPFIIEWIPDILPNCHIGELRIKFEYGHLRNGQLETRQSIQASQPDLSLQSQAIQLREILPS